MSTPVPKRTAEKWINWAHEMEAEATRLSQFGFGHEAGKVRAASVALGDAGRKARDRLP